MGEERDAILSACSSVNPTHTSIHADMHILTSASAHIRVHNDAFRKYMPHMYTVLPTPVTCDTDFH